MYQDLHQLYCDVMYRYNIFIFLSISATSHVSLTNNPSSSSNGDFIPKTVQSAQSKIETIRSWSVNTFKCTKQYIAERLGKSSKTVDLELDAQIEVLRDMQRKYANILRLAKMLTTHFCSVVQTQRALGEAFSEQAQRSPELQEEFSYNCETQRALVKNGEVLLGKIFGLVSCAKCVPYLFNYMLRHIYSIMEIFSDLVVTNF